MCPPRAARSAAPRKRCHRRPLVTFVSHVQMRAPPMLNLAASAANEYACAMYAFSALLRPLPALAWLPVWLWTPARSRVRGHLHLCARCGQQRLTFQLCVRKHVLSRASALCTSAWASESYMEGTHHFGPKGTRAAKDGNVPQLQRYEGQQVMLEAAQREAASDTESCVLDFDARQS